MIERFTFIFIKATNIPLNSLSFIISIRQPLISEINGWTIIGLLSPTLEGVIFNYNDLSAAHNIKRGN
jgi:hypothetical protein